MVANFFFFGSMASILLVGSILCQKGILEVGDIASFMLYMIQILINFMMLAHVFGSVMTVSPSIITFSGDRCLSKSGGNHGLQAEDQQ